jgi:hypothetical protein
MAQKRMFDRAIIEQDKFLNISLSAKAIYFLLGMEADDEGFVSPNRVIRLYGGEAGDLKNLIDTGLVIPFQSGVVVITDWNQNNWLDDRRTRPTQYQKEKKLLLLTEHKQYVLSNGSARVEEKSIEQSRIEEKRVTPAQEARSFFEGNIETILKEFVDKTGVNEDTLKKEFAKFILYWTEKNKSGTRQKWEQQDTFEVKRRLATWLGRVTNFTSNKRETKII